MASHVQKLMAEVRSKNPAELEFHQVVQELAESLSPVMEHNPHYAEARVLERIIEPERTLGFRVSWVDDAGRIQINRGYRVEMNGLIGPYKGGLRFHPSVNMGIFGIGLADRTFQATAKFSARRKQASSRLTVAGPATTALRSIFPSLSNRAPKASSPLRRRVLYFST